MYGVPSQTVQDTVKAHGATLVAMDPDERCGREWVGYRYVVRTRK
jgi:hypothetical protein